MEASKFGFGANTPAAFKFDPTDADLVAHYLVPRALRLHNPHEHAIVDADPASAAPWEVLTRHGHQDSEHAFFFGPPPAERKSRTRAVPGGGVWLEQRKAYEGTTTLVNPGGAEVDLGYRRRELEFYLAEGGPSAGYVMHEYEITSPPLPNTVLTRIKVLQNAYRPAAADAGKDGAGKQQDPDQQGPSHEDDDAAKDQPGPSDAAAKDEGSGPDDGAQGGTSTIRRNAKLSFVSLNLLALLLFLW